MSKFTEPIDVAKQFSQFPFSVFKETKAVLSGTIFAQILTNGVMLACSIVQIDFRFGQWSPQLFYGVYGVILAVGNAYLFCYFAARTSYDLRMISYPIFASNWYKMRNERQKETLMMIMFAQRAREFNGFGIIVCNLETFVWVSFRDFLSPI